MKVEIPGNGSRRDVVIDGLCHAHIEEVKTNRWKATYCGEPVLGEKGKPVVEALYHWKFPGTWRALERARLAKKVAA
jgi:hypothetical protein